MTCAGPNGINQSGCCNSLAGVEAGWPWFLVEPGQQVEWLVWTHFLVWDSDSAAQGSGFVYYACRCLHV